MPLGWLMEVMLDILLQYTYVHVCYSPIIPVYSALYILYLLLYISVILFLSQGICN